MGLNVRCSHIAVAKNERALPIHYKNHVLSTSNCNKRAINLGKIETESKYKSLRDKDLIEC